MEAGRGSVYSKTDEQQWRGFALAGVIAGAVPCWFRPGKAVILILLGVDRTPYGDHRHLRQTCPDPTGNDHTVTLGMGPFAAYLAAGGGRLHWLNYRKFAIMSFFSSVTAVESVRATSTKAVPAVMHRIIVMIRPSRLSVSCISLINLWSRDW